MIDTDNEGNRHCGRMGGRKINTSRFYFEWKGHNIADATTFRNTTLSLRPNKPIVYLAGDSSLDNKYWVPSSGPEDEPLSVDVPEIYLEALDRPHPRPDVAFWLNHFLGDRATTLNLAVEASTLKERETNLLEHDEFIRDNIRAEDILIVSVGANDIAMRPTFATIRHMLRLAWFTPRFLVDKGWFMGHFIDMFKDQTEAYISKIVAKQKPRAVIVCMIYFPLEAGLSKEKGWADPQLKALGYDWFPGQLRTLIMKMYELATKKVQIPGVKVVPCALYEAMDGKHGEDYTARVEPSAEGGRKMALKLKEIVESLIEGEE